MIKEKMTIENDSKYVRIGSKHKGDYVVKSKIIYIEAFESYSWIYTGDGFRFLSCKPIGYYQEIFSREGFIRIHRSYLVNSSQVKRYEPDYRLMHLECSITLPVSFRRNRQLSKKRNIV
ncbi:LytR/AlgR family response regulator transcription factor [Kordia zhangzhouensis]|uniref:LytR/AlgR family response regulator transcription factor n=1 Tax=Kordia zhangzhouensis TaxID=1620405 RepID=UPI0006291962|nr:LytTR family transcriptional regulator DNA-binding domain-containing protein [Kordia zhangzhouensis]